MADGLKITPEKELAFRCARPHSSSPRGRRRERPASSSPRPRVAFVRTPKENNLSRLATDLSLTPPVPRSTDAVELKKTIPTTIKITNSGKEETAFKVKTTAPKKYCVKPNTGFVRPGRTQMIQVIMQAQREWPADIRRVRVSSHWSPYDRDGVVHAVP